jgi:carbamate kinase
MRIVIALGGNAMTAPDGSATQLGQTEAVATAMDRVAELVALGHEVLITHGNGPQVGNLLVKNEIAAEVVPPVSLDWCGAQTQGTIGFTVINALEHSLRAAGAIRPVAAVVTRTLVDGEDPHFQAPTKPVGRFLPRDEAQRMIDFGQTWEDRGERGWRRVVASPEPLRVVDLPAVQALMAAGFVVVAAGGGGIPVIAGPDGDCQGVEAVIDKDLTAALLAADVGAEILLIATDVDHVVAGFGTPDATEIGQVTVSEMRAFAEAGHFPSGSMGPKVEAALRFVERGGQRSVITSLDRLAAAVEDGYGTAIVPRP